MFFIPITLIGFLNLLVLSLTLFFSSLNFLLLDYVIFLEWELLSLNSNSIVMGILLDWMFLWLMGLVFLYLFIYCTLKTHFMILDCYKASVLIVFCTKCWLSRIAVYTQY